MTRTTQTIVRNIKPPPPFVLLSNAQHNHPSSNAGACICPKTRHSGSVFTSQPTPPPITHPFTMSSEKRARHALQQNPRALVRARTCSHSALLFCSVPKTHQMRAAQCPALSQTTASAAVVWAIGNGRTNETGTFRRHGSTPTSIMRANAFACAHVMMKPRDFRRRWRRWW